MVDSSARGRAQTDAQGRGDDGAGSEESIGEPPSGGDLFAVRGFCFLRSLTFFGGVSEELRPWAIKRERSPGRFCPAFLMVFVVQSKRSRVRVRSMRPAFHTGNPGFRSSPLIDSRRAGLGAGGLWARPALDGLATADNLGATSHFSRGK